MIKIYKTLEGKYRWRITAKNNEIIDASTQGFASKQKAKGNLELVKEALDEYFPATDAHAEIRPSREEYKGRVELLEGEAKACSKEYFELRTEAEASKHQILTLQKAKRALQKSFWKRLKFLFKTE